MKTCAKCGGWMLPGNVIEQTYTGVPDFIGDSYPVTLSAGGPANWWTASSVRSVDGV